MINLPGKEELRSKNFSASASQAKETTLQSFERFLAAQEQRKPFLISMHKTGPGIILLSENELAEGEVPYPAVHSYFEQLQQLTNETANEHYVLDRIDSIYADGEYVDTDYSRDYRSKVEHEYQKKENAREEQLDSIYEDRLNNDSNYPIDVQSKEEQVENVQDQDNGLVHPEEQREMSIEDFLERELDRADKQENADEKGQDQGLSGSEDQNLDADHDYDYGYSL